jgi:hypothetical protein
LSALKLRRKAPRRNPTKPVKKNRSKSLKLLAAALTLVFGSVLAANSIVIPLIELGNGVEEIPSCIEDAVVDFTMSSKTDTATISEVEVGPVGSECSGRYLRVTLEGSSQSVIRRLNWQLPSTGGPFTRTANASTIGSPAIEPEDVEEIVIEISENPF